VLRAVRGAILWALLGMLVAATAVALVGVPFGALLGAGCSLVFDDGDELLEYTVTGGGVGLIVGLLGGAFIGLLGGGIGGAVHGTLQYVHRYLLVAGAVDRQALYSPPRPCRRFPVFAIVLLILVGVSTGGYLGFFVAPQSDRESALGILLGGWVGACSGALVGLLSWLLAARVKARRSRPC
jgi:hypothetical protein